MSVSSSLFLPRRAHSLFVLLPALVGLALVPGCGESDTYSEAVQFRVRTDPFFMEVPSAERFEPDPPGVLPLKTMKQDEKLVHLFPADTGATIPDKLRDPTKISSEDHTSFQDTLDDIFGSPAQPRLKVTGSEAARAKLKLTEPMLKEGSKLYRLYCMQCHGVTGDGRGPTAQWVNPHPRDYRVGLFKFQSADQTEGEARKPLRSDLYRVIYDGVEGTAMPAHNLLPDSAIDAIVSYVILLSIRGEAELSTFRAMSVDKNGQLDPKGLPLRKIATQLHFLAKKIAGEWADSQDHPIDAVPYPYGQQEPPVDSVQRGYALFLAEPSLLRKAFPADLLKTMFTDMTAKTPEELETMKLARLKGGDCMSCHKDYGRQAPYKFDVWGTLVRPQNLTTGVYRGGRRPIDLYWRIHSGIPGSGMANFGSKANGLPGEQIWDLVNFIRTVPYREMMKNKYHIEVP